MVRVRGKTNRHEHRGSEADGDVGYHRISCQYTARYPLVGVGGILREAAGMKQRVQKRPRGFAAPAPAQRRTISSLGGQATARRNKRQEIRVTTDKTTDLTGRIKGRIIEGVGGPPHESPDPSSNTALLPPAGQEKDDNAAPLG